jgi:predicted protein tyrosine phosphatase
VKQDISAIVTIMPSVPKEVFAITRGRPGLRHFHYMLDDHIEYGDEERHNLSTLFPDSPHKNIFDVLEFMHDARLAGRAVMVHCEQGKRRSAAVMAAYLIWYRSLSRKDAIQLIQAKRRGATIPGLWRDELQSLAERRALLDETADESVDFSRMLSQPDLRVQLEEELKQKVREKRRMSPTPQQRLSPTEPESPDSAGQPLTFIAAPCLPVPVLPPSPPCEGLTRSPTR